MLQLREALNLLGPRLECGIVQFSVVVPVLPDVREALWVFSIPIDIAVIDHALPAKHVYQVLGRQVVRVAQAPLLFRLKLVLSSQSWCSFWGTFMKVGTRLLPSSSTAQGMR